MGPIEQMIEEILRKEFHVEQLEIENESHKHASGLGTESHFKVLLITDDFQDMKRIDRSRKVHELLKTPLESIHALSLKLYTLTEWQKTNPDLLISPNCSGKKTP